MMARQIDAIRDEEYDNIMGIVFWTRCVLSSIAEGHEDWEQKETESPGGTMLNFSRQTFGKAGEAVYLPVFP